MSTSLSTGPLTRVLADSSDMLVCEKGEWFEGR